MHRRVKSPSAQCVCNAETEHQQAGRVGHICLTAVQVLILNAMCPEERPACVQTLPFLNHRTRASDLPPCCSRTESSNLAVSLQHPSEEFLCAKTFVHCFIFSCAVHNTKSSLFLSSVFRFIKYMFKEIESRTSGKRHGPKHPCLSGHTCQCAVALWGM